MFTNKEMDAFMKNFFPSMNFDMDMEKMENCECEGSCECTSENHCGCMGEKSKPFVYGFDIKIVNGRPVVKEWGNMESPFFGNIPKRMKKIDDKKAKIEFIDNPKEHKGKVIAEMPGVEKKDFQLTYRDAVLHIDVQGDIKEYHESIKIPVKVDHSTIKATYQNGILGVEFDYDKGVEQKTISVE